MRRRAEAWAKLTALNEDGTFAERFLGLVAEGEDPTRLAHDVFGVTWWVVREWIESSTDRMQAYESAKRAGADRLMYDALGEVRGAGIETVQLAKLRADRFDRMAGKLDRKQWGDKVEVTVEQTINIVDVLKEARARVVGKIVEGNAERVPDVVPQIQEMVI